MKILFVILSAFFAQSAIAQSAPIPRATYLTISYDSVTMYHYNLSKHEDDAEIIVAGELSRSQVIKGVTLDRKTAALLSRKLMDRASYGVQSATCYHPHHALVYWQHGRPIADVCICMGCRVVSPSLPISVQNQGDQYPGSTRYIGSGMSASLQAYLQKLIDKNGL